MASDSSQQIDLFCTQQLFGSSTSVNLTMVAVTALISTYFYSEAGHLLIIWGVSMCLIAGARILITQQFFIDQKDNFKKLGISSWLKIYIASTFILGSASASLILFMPKTMSLVDTSILYICLFSAMAASIATLPVALPAFIAFTTPLFLAIFSFSFFHPSKLSVFISAISVVYFAFILSAGRLLNKRYMQNLSLANENENLINKLHNEIKQKELAQKELIKNHQNLEKTVKARTQELADINDVLTEEINERHRIENDLKHVAHHDSLTNLPNRLLLDARLNHAIERAKRDNLHVAVMFIDLDHFKIINDSLGHYVGDKLLITISNRLKNCVREDDTVARLGGDEFIIIIEQVHDIADLDSLLKKIMHVTSETMSIDNHELSTSASIGISVYPDDGKNAEDLMRNADSAMYYVKDHGRHKYHFYTRGLTTTSSDRIILETDLKHGIEDNQILVQYQPQVSLETKKIIAVEALVRWQHPELGILLPHQFLKIAEQSNLIYKIGKVVLTTACKQIVKWKQQGLPLETVAVNISGNQIHHSNLVETVDKILQQTKCKADWLELEITEDFIIKKTTRAISTLQKLRDLGVSLAIDNFGTGYSSLSHLKQLPINKIKIDRSFIDDINHEAGRATLAQAIITMGKSLHLKLIAEGVENEYHETFLSTHGCDYAQGAYYSKPVSAEKIENMFTPKNDDPGAVIKLISK